MTTTITPKHGGRFVVPQKENEMAITDQERATYKKWAEGFPTTTSGNIRTGTEVAIGKLFNALEAAEARADEAEAWATQLVWTVTDGRMSKLYDIEVIEEEVDTLWAAQDVAKRGEEV